MWKEGQKNRPSATQEISLLGQLVLGEDRPRDEVVTAIAGLQNRDFLYEVAYGHHVVLRGFVPLKQAAEHSGRFDLVDWAAEKIGSEQSRIDAALQALDEICQAMESSGYPVTVMKSLDHWPDIGNDIDLYTSASREVVGRLLQRKFGAWRKRRTWGDQLANKCSYGIPGLRTTIEVHHGRLGQTGEHRMIAQRLLARRRWKKFSEHVFPVPAPEEQLMAATLQRMYRHFFVRVCDVANTMGLLRSGSVDFEELRAASEPAGIWPGVISYLTLTSEYARTYRAHTMDFNTENAPLSKAEPVHMFVRGAWLRVPMRHAFNLYLRQLSRLALRGDVSGALRLALLPPLASVARLAYLATGTAEGIW